MSKLIARLVIVGVLLFTGLSVYFITQLKFDYEFEHFFPTDDPDLDFYKSYMEKFSPDVDFVLIGAKNEAGIFEEEFLAKMLKMRQEIGELDRVDGIMSPFDVKDFALGPFGPIPIPYLHPEDPSRYAADSLKIYQYGKAVGSLFSPDAKSISMLVEIEPGLSKLKTDTLYSNLLSITDQYTFDEFHMAGKAIGQAYYINQIKHEFTFFFSLGVLLILTILILIYRSFWGVAVPLLVVLLSVIWLLGIMGMTGKSIDIMTILLPLILFVVGIADVIHLLSRYFEEIRNGLAKNEAIGLAYKQVGMATFLTSVTTALGFLTLVTSDIKPVKELGLYAALGVFVAFFLAFSLLPAILVLTKVPKLAYKEPSTVLWNRLVDKIFRQSIRYTKLIVGSTIILVVLSVIGISQIKVDNFLLEDVGAEDPTRGSFIFFESNFAGVRPFEMFLEVTDSTKTLFDFEAIQELQLIETYLKEEYGVGFVASPLTMVRATNQALHGGKDSAYVVPTTATELKPVLRLLSKLEKRPEFSSIVTEKGKQGRFSGKITDYGGYRTREMNAEMRSYLDENIGLKQVKYKLTGMALLIDKSNITLSSDMMEGLIVALVIVAIIVGLMFRSLKVALISLLPNILPLLAIGGVMGFFGIDLKVATSIIFGITFGIAVDDSIHFLSKYRLERLKGRTNMIAIRRTSLSTGKAIILTTLILCAGFTSLAFSDFKSTFYVGVLISITLAIAVMADLYLLPILLRWINKK